VVAAIRHFLAEADPLHPQHVGGAARVAETRQIDCPLVDFDPDQRTAFGQAHRLDGIEWVERYLTGGIGGIGRAAGDVVIRGHGKDETCAERVGGPDQIADVDGLADPFDADAEISPHGGRFYSRLEIAQVFGVKRFMNEDLREQYENYPYPPRDAADEAKRLITGSPSHIAEIEHHIFAGNRPDDGTFRILVAGGGTGDAAVMLAQQHASAGIDAEIVHLDISEASAAIAKARIDARGLTNTRFVHGAIEAIPTLDLGKFDYIDCCGVLHHLEDPVAGLNALRGALKPAGGMGIMIYAPLGRTGVYHAQAMLQMIAGTAPDPERIDIARQLLGTLPESNWLKRNPHVGDHVELGDAGIYDLLLHRRDRAYSVPELAGLLQQGGMRPVNFVDPARYEPSVYLNDRALVDRLKPLNWLQRCAFAELLAGNMKTHIVYAVHGDNQTNTLAVPDSFDVIPVMRDDDGPALAGQIKPGMSLNVDMEGVKLSLPLPEQAATILARIDGERSLTDIHAAMENPPDANGFKQQFDQLYSSFYGISRMFLRKPAAT